jgi:cytochrome c-type biogenesis protein CcmH/NrfG
VEAAHAAMVRATEASAQEATVTWENVVALVRDTKDWAGLAEREAWERVSRVEAKSPTPPHVLPAV